MLRWSRVRLYLSILTCEGLFATLRERVQYAPPLPPKPKSEERGGKTLGMPRFYDYAGALHVHSTYSDGAGSVEEIAAAANRAGLDFLVLCDHSNLQAITNGEDGWHGRTLMLIGTEITTDAGHLLALDVPDTFIPAPHDAEAAQNAIRQSGGLGFVALPCDLKDHWRDFSRMQEGIGLEVFNLSAIARTKINLPALAEVWRLYNSSSPLRAFHMVAARPSPELRLWDKLMAAPGPGLPSRRVVGIASLDAHAVMKFARRSYPFPTYEETFRTLRTHLLTSEPLSYGEAADRTASREKDGMLVHSAVALGHCYMAYDNYADPTGFTFEAGPSRTPANKSPLALMGDAVTFPAEVIPGSPAIVLTARAPRTRSLVRLYKDGHLVAAARGGRLEYTVSTPGVYRIEVFLYRRRIGSLCLGAKPWIFSNPIYVQPAALPASTPSSPQTTDSSAQTHAN
ncbi:MAG: PHP domain-containing protein [Janthinobacterium lividum]